MSDDNTKIDPIGEFGLTAKQRLFAEYYVMMLNGTKAAIKAGYSEDSARQISTENLRKPSIKAYIEKLFDAAKMGPKEVIGQLTALSRADIGNYIKNHKVIRNGVEVEEWTFDLVQAIKDNNTGMIKSIKRDRYGTVVELYDKVRMLELIGKHNRLFADITITSDKPDRTAEDLTDNELAAIIREDATPSDDNDEDEDTTQSMNEPLDAPGDATSDDNTQADDI